MVNIESIKEIEEYFEEPNKFSELWNLNRFKLWGYFFFGKSAEKLNQLRTLLVRDGYRFVELEQDVPDCYLYVEKEDVHTAASLHRQLEEFAVLGEQFEMRISRHPLQKARNYYFFLLFNYY